MHHAGGIAEESIDLVAQGRRSALVIPIRHRAPKTADAVASGRLGPGAQQVQGFSPGQIRVLILRGHRRQGVGLAEAIIGVERPTHHGLAELRLRRQLRQLRHGHVNVFIGNRARGLQHNLRLGVGQERGHGRIALTPQRDQGRQPHGRRFVPAQLRHRQGLAQSLQRHDPAMAHDRVTIIVTPQHGHHGVRVVAANFTERNRRLRLGAGVVAAEQLNQAGHSGLGLGFAEDLGRLRLHFAVRITQQRYQRAVLVLPVARQLAETPHRVQPRQPFALPGNASQRFGVGFGHQLELGGLSHAHIRMTKKIAQSVGVDLVEALAEQLLHRGRIAQGLVGIGDAIDTALAGHGPAVDPVRNIGVTIEAELHIGRQRLPHQSTGLLYLEVRAHRRVTNGVHAAARGAAFEIAHEKHIGVLIAQTDAGIIGQPRWAIADIGHGRNAMGGFAVGETHALIQPRAAARGPRGSLKKLPANAPAAVAAFHGIDPARGVATVGVIVAGKQVAVRVKGQLLRIP